MQERYIATVDLGTSKLALCVAKVIGENVQIIYYKERPSDGMRYNCVYNPRRAAGPLRAAIAEAEDELQKLTDSQIKEIDKIAAEKEKEIMEV